MARIGNQGDGIREKSKSAFDGNENQIEDHRNAHAQIDAVGGQCMRMAVVTMGLPVTVPVIVRAMVIVIVEGLY